MSKTLIAFFSRADENYFGGSMKYNFEGKTILPLCTNEGSGMGRSESDIKKYAPGADVKSGLSVNGSQAANAKDDVKTWLSNYGLI